MAVTKKEQSGEIICVLADVEYGSVNHLIISNHRLITALGLRNEPHDTISMHQSKFLFDETFVIELPSGQHINDPEAFLHGELVPARHAYLNWLDLRNSSDPKAPPLMREAETIAKQSGRRRVHVWKDIKKVWDLEMGTAGLLYRNKRETYFGEDPSYVGKEVRFLRSTWG